MKQKIREEIKNIDRKIECKQKELDIAVEVFKESAASYDAYNIETFLPGKIEEIARCRAEIAKLTEQKQMLDYIVEQ